MAGNNSLQVLRGNGHSSGAQLLPGQPYYDYTNNKLYIGGENGTAINAAKPIGNEVTSVNRKTGDVVLSYGDLGLVVNVITYKETKTLTVSGGVSVSVTSIGQSPADPARGAATAYLSPRSTDDQGRPLHFSSMTITSNNIQLEETKYVTSAPGTLVTGGASLGQPRVSGTSVSADIIIQNCKTSGGSLNYTASAKAGSTVTVEVTYEIYQVFATSR